MATDRCPRSLLSVESLDWVERFFVWQRFGTLAGERLSAKDIDAFAVLQDELVKEMGRHE